MDTLFKEKSQFIKIYRGKEFLSDPYEKKPKVTYLNPLPIRAIVTDLTATQASWKMPGVIIEKAKEIIVQKKYKSLFERSHKIEIDDEDYEGWRVNGRAQYRTEGDYLRIYIYSKHV